MNPTFWIPWAASNGLGAGLLVMGAVSPRMPEAPTPAAPVQRVVEDPKEVSIHELTSIEYERGKALPDEILALDGLKVKITGYMATNTLEGQDRFRLTFDACGCSASKVHHFVEVAMPDGETTRYDPSEITMTGTFSVGEKEEDGFVTSIYRLTNVSFE